jgi:hypothetical protein
VSNLGGIIYSWFIFLLVRSKENWAGVVMALWFSQLMYDYDY